jgi:diguanylate cyclase (GGDEF)-like protein/PAS domain S-box-containing protein
MDYQFTPLILLVLMAVLVTGLSLRVLRLRAIPGAKWLIILLLAVSEWSVAFALESLGVDLRNKQFWAQMEFFGIVTAPAAWLCFSQQFACPPQHPKRSRWSIFLLLLPSLLSLIVVWTPAWQETMWVRYRLDQEGPFLVKDYYPGSWLFATYAYGLFVYGSYLLLKKTHKEGGELRVLRQAVESSSEAVFITDIDGLITYINPAFTRLYGFGPEEVVGMTTPRLLKSGRLSPEEYQSFWQTLLSKQVFKGQLVNRTKGGRFLTIEGSANAILNEEGEITGFLAIQRNVSHQKKDEEEIQQSENNYRDLVEHSRDLICTHDLEGRLLSVNQFALDSLGVGLEEVIGHNIRDLLLPEMRAGVDDYLETICKTGQAQGKVKISTHSGEIRIWEYNNTLRTEGVSRPIVRGSAHDITQEYRIQKLLQRKVEELTLLHAVAVIGAEATDMDGLLREATRLIGESLFPDNFGILLLNQSGQMLYMHSSYHILANRDLKIPLGKGIAGRVAASGEALRVDDISDFPDYIAGQVSTRAELCVPLRGGDHVIGVINVESSKVGAFSEDDERLLITFASQLGIAIDKIRLLESERIHARQQTALFRLSADLANCMDEREVCQRVVRGLHDTLGYDNLGIFLVDKEKDERVMTASAGWDQAPTEWRISNREGLGGIVIESGKLHYTPDVRLSPVYIPGISNALSEVDLPIISGDEVIGVLNVESTKLNAFTENDFAILTAAVSQTALAIQRARLFKQVQQLAITDDLTGVNNRRNFIALAELEFSRSRRYQRPVTALMVDVDNFKNINDTYGHATGDQALHALAQYLLRNLRRIDILGRFGGDEFAVILSETDLAGGIVTAERLRQSASEMSIHTKGGDINLTVSVGVATAVGNYPDLTTLIERADNALLAAKDGGRDRIMVADL